MKARLKAYLLTLLVLVLITLKLSSKRIIIKMIEENETMGGLILSSFIIQVDFHGRRSIETAIRGVGNKEIDWYSPFSVAAIIADEICSKAGFSGRVPVLLLVNGKKIGLLMKNSRRTQKLF